MFDYSPQLETFHASKVALPTVMQQRLYSHRAANRNRLIARIPTYIAGVSLSEASFKPQGSVAMKTVIQTCFEDEEYDIDDGLVLRRDQLVDQNGNELSARTVRERVRAALRDDRFNKQPVLMTNCVRVFYADSGTAKHHVDIPVYRKWTKDDGTTVRELASEDGWVESDPTQVTSWFEELVKTLNATHDGAGTQLRKLVRLVKRFCRSREAWLDLLPNGMKLTMLVAECYGSYDDRLDVAFRRLLETMLARLARSQVIRNLAHPDQPDITRTAEDPNVLALEEKIAEAVEALDALDAVGVGFAEARKAWDRIFQSQSFFESLDDALERGEAVTDARKAVHVRNRLPWVEPIPWPVRKQYEVRVSAQHSLKQQAWRSFSSGSPLAKGLSLRFQPSANVDGPHEFYWQIVNTGDEAYRDRCMRGEIIEPSTRASGVRTEATAYSGRHWVECFVVREGVCVARSGPFIVFIP